MKKREIFVALCGLFAILGTTLPAGAAPGKSSSDLAIMGSDSPDPATEGGQLTYSFQVSNHGPANASSVTFNDTLPADVTLVSATSTQGSCTGTSSSVTCTLGTLAASSGADVEVVVQPSQAGTITTNANISASQRDPDGSNNSVSLTTEVRAATATPSADVLVSSVGGRAVGFKAYLVQITASAQNDGPAPATNVRITVSGTWTNLTAVSNKGICTGASCLIPLLLPGEQALVAAVGTRVSSVNPGYSYAGAWVTAAEPDPNPYNNHASGGVYYTSVPQLPDVCGKLCF